mmetsp:Transcript_109875/g.310891  ORF Transcript_109875/g.310891 Transcript_109875/m.310891 type:complete len:449 (+) Transcript_109875:112-1458(+)
MVEITAVTASALCACICGKGRRDHLDTIGGADILDLGPLDEVDEPPFQPPPVVTGRLSYSVLAEQTLRGAPMREGTLWYLSAMERAEPVQFSLHINGFRFVHAEEEISVSLSPFALVRNCKFQSNYSNQHFYGMKIFKVSLFTLGTCYYYGVRGEDERVAEEERSRWVLDISRVMRLVTQSLFPQFRISCDPLESVASTARRLMAGYLIHHDDESTASVLYCELHPHSEDQAKLVIYENELCQVPVDTLYITDQSMCCEKVGINCSCFCVEDRQFATRTLSERKLWLRAISNVKVKLQNRAPSPTCEDLRHYRLAIKEHISTIKATLEGQAPMDALLQRSLRKPAPAPGVVQCGAAFPMSFGRVGVVGDGASSTASPEPKRDGRGDATDLGAIQLIMNSSPPRAPKTKPLKSKKNSARPPCKPSLGVGANFGTVIPNPQDSPQPSPVA